MASARFLGPTGADVSLYWAMAPHSTARPLSLSAPVGPRNLALAIGKRLRLEGMLVGDHYGLQPQFVAEVGGWLREGKLVFEETVVEGFDQAVDAFLGLLRGANTGKMLVRVAD
jgi:NADPH-dependent curcumin reductase CurA